MKKRTILIAILIIAILVFSFGFSKPAKNTERALINGKSTEKNLNQNSLVPINFESSSFKFEGYGPGKSHLGIFSEISGNIEVEENKIIGMNGKIQSNSVSTGIDKLDNHLKTSDFLNTENYPEISFVSNSIENNKMTGTLTFKGISKEISFPVEITENSISSDFILDTAPFGEMSPLANKEVRITFNFQYN